MDVVFRRFNDFGIEVNFIKVKWLAREMSFLGYKIKDGELRLKKYLEKKKEGIGYVSNVHELEKSDWSNFVLKKSY